MRWVYFVEAIGTGRVKVGETDDVNRRLVQLQVSCPYKLNLLGTIPENVVKEKDVKLAFKRFHIRGEWFEYSDLVRRATGMLVGEDQLKRSSSVRWIQNVVQRERRVHDSRTSTRQRVERPKTEYLEVRIEPDEKEGFKEAAEIEGIALSAWVRQTLRKAARTVLEETDRPVPFLSKHQAAKGKNR